MHNKNNNAIIFNFRLHRLIFFVICLALLSLSGCTNRSDNVLTNAAANSLHIKRLIDYQHQLPDNHPDSISSLMHLDDDLKKIVSEKFGDSKHAKITVIGLSDWLLDKDQLAMSYDLSANLTPQEAYNQRVANCLSFSLLFYALSHHLGVDMKLNYVDIPNIWGQESPDNLTLYRHVNTVVRMPREYFIVDLAIENYDYGYPQEIVSVEDVIARLHSNRATAWLQSDDLEKALHSIKLAVSLSPSNEDLWINLGVIYKKLKKIKHAEEVFLLAYQLNKSNELTASSLERFYQQQGQLQLANKYHSAAKRARNNNPYYHFEVAQTHYAEQAYKKARVNIKRAISLHKTDPQFYQLSSQIEQHLKRYDLALIDVVTAHELSRNKDDQDRFAGKARLISQHIEQNDFNLDRLDRAIESRNNLRN